MGTGTFCGDRQLNFLMSPRVVGGLQNTGSFCRTLFTYCCRGEIWVGKMFVWFVDNDVFLKSQQPKSSVFHLRLVASSVLTPDPSTPCHYSRLSWEVGNYCMAF